MLISTDQLEQSAMRFSAVKDIPDRENIEAFQKEVVLDNVAPSAVKGNIIGKDANLVKRKEMLEAINKEPVDFALERAIGKNDSVYSNFVELIRVAKQRVGRIAIKNGNKNIGFATGFMVAENLLLTNWHVFPTIEDVADSQVQFFYEYDTNGNPITPVSFDIASNVFYTSSKELDYCFVAVASSDISGKKKLSDIGYIYLDPALGKLGNEKEEALNIIHHPDGDYKQLSIRENLFVKITPISIWYQTDTAPGSSGSPVFNDQWQVVALHHSGVARKDADGDYVDKDGKKIMRDADGKIDTARIVWDANEGIRISVILKDVFAKFPDEPILKGLNQAPKQNSAIDESVPGPKPEPNVNNKPSRMESNNQSNQVSISFPSSLIEKNGYINININQGPGGGAVVKPSLAASAGTDEVLDEEIKKLEQTTDFSGCKGYQSKFLGSSHDIPIPQPRASIRKFIAKVNGTDSMVLKYYNYSTIFHSVRMMPIISAINVDGDPEKRKDNTTRKDTWLRDTRLSFDIQLNDAYYSGSGFDKGHMSRREDANWGATAAEAKRNADLTCMYTNACPQVAKINQNKKRGLWGKLELVVLENGAEQENGKTGKISAFNGPIFKDDDPVFRGIQVPMDFYKIVLWLTDKGDLKATAFKLSQTKLVSDIDFEQLDLDQNTEFQEYQCSIRDLQKATKIDFSDIIPYDTFEGNEGEEVALGSEMEVMTHVKKHSA